jgi:hypothetical protein
MQQSALIALLPALVGGCTSMRSMAGATDGKMVTGIPYFLPKQMLRITGERSQTDLEKAFTKLGAAQAEFDLVSAKHKVATAQVEIAKIALQASKEAGAALAGLQAELGKLDGEARLLSKQKADAEKALQAANDAKNNLVNPSAAHACQYHATIAILDPVADHSTTYYLQPQHDVLRDDQVKLTLTKDGLLTNAETISVGRAADVIAEFAASVGAITTANDNKPRLSAIDECAWLPDKFAVDFDPTSGASMTAANSALEDFGLKVSKPEETDKSGKINGSEGDKMRPAGSGIIYRSPGSVAVSIEDRSGTPVLTTTLSLPQAGKLAFLPMHASPFVKTTNNLRFENGMLVAVDSNRPSEALEVARLPARAIGALFSGAASTFGALGGAIAGRKDVSAAQLEAFTAEQKLLAVTECVNQARQDGKPTIDCFD